MKPLIIGEAPSKNEHPPSPIAGRIGRRLAKCAGMNFEAFLEHFDRVNLLEVRQDTAEHGFKFDMGQARHNAVQLIPRMMAAPYVLLLGRRVSAAFWLDAAYFTRIRFPRMVNGGVEEGAVVYIVPHPSGFNHWWNDPEHVRQAEDFMRGMVAQHV